MKRLVSIEFLRFIFMSCIILMHCDLLVRGVQLEYRLCPRAAFGVEFFFFVSGALMMASVSQKKGVENLGLETFLFIARKFKRIFPMLVFSAGMTILVEIVFARRYGCGKGLLVLCESLLASILIKESGRIISIVMASAKSFLMNIAREKSDE